MQNEEMPSRKKWIWRGIGSVLYLLLLIFLFFGYLHTPPGRSWAWGQKLLSRVGYSCPDDFRYKPLQEIKGVRASPTKSIWGLTLNQTSEYQLIQWVQRRKINCDKRRIGYSYIKCPNVPLKKLGFPIENSRGELNFVFDSRSKLIFVGLLHRKLQSEKALEILNTLSEDLNKRLGKPSRAPASMSLADLDSEKNSVSYEYRFKDYVARITATKVSSAGIILYEQHVFIP